VFVLLLHSMTGSLLFVQVIGSWGDVLVMCEKGHLQPQVLFFEASK
jgi:hypothetical protein